MNTGTLVRVVCSQCGHSERWQLEHMLSRLRTIGKLRRAQDPGADLIVELIHASSHLFRCGVCDRVGLSIEESDDEDDWPEARTCERCGQPIPLQRLEVFPDANWCAKCQSARQTGQDDGQREFCPRCGGLMTVRVSRRAGISRYESVCRDCGHK